MFPSRHPLFSLLALLLEKCEQATQGYIPSNSPNSSSTSSPNGSTNNNENDSFSRDIQVSVHALNLVFNLQNSFQNIFFSGICTADRERETTFADQQRRARWSYDQSTTSSPDSLAGAWKGSGVVSRFLHKIHCVSAWENAVRESPQIWLLDGAHKQ